MKTYLILGAIAVLGSAGWLMKEPSECSQWKFETQYVTQSGDGKMITKREGKWVCRAGPLSEVKATNGD